MTMKLFKWFKDTLFKDWSPSADELAEHYREMSDPEFKRLDPRDLTPTARACYQAEVKFRSSNPSSAETSRNV